MGKVMRQHMRERMEKVCNFSLHPPMPQNLSIELNNTCNQCCVFCSYHGEYSPKKLKAASLEIEFVKSLLKQAYSLGIGKKEVGFYLAGEPFLYNGLVDVVAYAKKLGFQYTFLTTNGALVTQEKTKAVIDAGLDSIRFSVNATDKETYKEVHGRDDFENVVDNIRYTSEYIRKSGASTAISLSCVLTKKTANIQDEIRKLFAPYVEDIMFIPVILSRLKNMEQLRSEYQIVNDDGMEINKNYICPLLFETMIINASGNVIPCCGAYDVDLVFANVKDDSDLAKIWHNKSYEYYRRIFINDVSDKGTICEKCLLRMSGVERLSLEE